MGACPRSGARAAIARSRTPRAVPRGDPGRRRGSRAAVGARAGEGRGPASLAQDARVGTLCLWPLHKEALATASVKLGQKCIQLANLLPASWLGFGGVVLPEQGTQQQK